MSDITSIWLSKKIRVRGAAVDAMHIAAAGEDLSILFEAWGVQLQTADRPNVGAVVLEIDAPLKLPSSDKLIGFFVTLRGFAAVSRGGSVSIVGYVGDTRRDFQLAYGDVTTDELSSQNLELSFLTAKEAFLPTVKKGVQSRTLKIRLVFYAQRIDATHVAVVTLDSIDIDALVVDAPARKSPKSAAGPRP